ncbi:hypothetical protein OVA03_14380 [Asticcacaulis sp. SL142]|uniref:tetratricopeptide repeat protein n=1 Tax=Asticcacaulis sp. SL142 TaxID=2995155 RepID=UPI00226D28AD|nr:hypothetical protein [Asticcacaulis sp. SL142]WAC47875.1 hypothetical protein OVA03_14380 [Asticcacaulis sp. SL142]
MQRNLSVLTAAAVIGSAFAPFHTAQAVQVHPPQTQTQTQADTPAKPHPESSGPTLEMTRLFLQMSKYAKADDTVGVVATLKEITAHPDFAGLFVDIRRDLYIQLAAYQYDLAAYTDAKASLDKAGALKGTPMTAGYWMMRSGLAMLTDNQAEAVESYTQLARQFPDAVLKSNPSLVFGLIYTSRSLNDKTAHKSLLEALHTIPIISRGHDSAEDLWFELLEIYVSDGQTDKAKAIANAFTTPQHLIMLRVDKRYQSLRTVIAADIETALEHELDEDRATIKANPRNLGDILRLVNALMEQNRTAAALAILDTELTKIEAAPKDKPPFDDLKDSYDWALDTRAQLLRQLGRYDDAEKAFIKASQFAKENGTDSIGSMINLSGFYLSQSRPAEALKVVSRTDTKSAHIYGKMASEAMFICASAQLGETDKIKAPLNRMLEPENVSAAYLPASVALVCAQDADRLAELIISHIKDPKTRNATLMSLQGYQDAPASTTYDLALNGYYKRVVQRDDVQAAVKTYGEIIAVPIQRMK